MGSYLRPVDLARAAGVSTQTVRNYEQWGYIPRAARSPSGSRCYEERHLDAMRAVRRMVLGYGKQTARHTMRLLRSGNVGAALAEANACHAALHQARLNVEAALLTLRNVASTLISGRLDGGRLHIGNAARRVGVPISTVRFWEQQGLLDPSRDQRSGYRVYDQKQLCQLQVLASLRQANYRVGTIRAVLAKIATGEADQAVAIAEGRLDEVQQATRRCIEATAALWVYLQKGTHW